MGAKDVGRNRNAPALDFGLGEGDMPAALPDASKAVFQAIDAVAAKRSIAVGVATAASSKWSRCAVVRGT